MKRKFVVQGGTFSGADEIVQEFRLLSQKEEDSDDYFEIVIKQYSPKDRCFGGCICHCDGNHNKNNDLSMLYGDLDKMINPDCLQKEFCVEISQVFPTTEHT